MTRSVSILIVGVGNRLREDDAFGPLVAEQLEHRIDDERVEILERATLTPELTENLAQASHVIFLDASAELAPGEFERRPISRDSRGDLALVHFLSPEALLEWTTRLFGKAPSAEIWLMGVAGTGLSEQLTPTVAGRLPEVLELLARRIQELLVE